jgi:predicted O-methyltransferase YrrM
MSRKTINLTETLYEYILAHSVREPPLFARLREVTAALPDSNMQISPEQGQFLALLVKLIGARQCIEVGTYTGYSSLAVASVLPPEGRLVACDINSTTAAIARQFWREAGVEKRIDLRLQSALKTLDELLAAGGTGQYDFAFIDADKTNYRAYYEKLLALIRAGGLIAVDNTLWGGRVADPNDTDADTAALRSFNDHVHNDERVDLSLVPIADGVTLLRKRG